MNRIAADEPDAVGMVPTPIRFYWHGREYEAAVSKTNTSLDRLIERHGGVRDLRGDYGRAWLLDPCSMILAEGLQGARMAEDAAAYAARQERRRAKAALAEEAATARRTKGARW